MQTPCIQLVGPWGLGGSRPEPKNLMLNPGKGGVAQMTLPSSRC